MPLGTKITLSLACQIKRYLWYRYRQDKIASKFGVSQTTVSRILHGRQWHEAPWPDGSRGGFPQHRPQHRLRETTPSKIEKRNQQPRYIPLSAEEPEPMEDHPKKEKNWRNKSNKFVEEGMTQRAKVKRGIEIISEQIDEEEKAQYKEALTVDSEARDKKRKKRKKIEALPWKVVLEKAGEENPLVNLAKEEQNNKLKKAIGAVYKITDEKEWASKGTDEMVGAVYKQLEEETS